MHSSCEVRYAAADKYMRRRCTDTVKNRVCVTILSLLLTSVGLAVLLSCTTKYYKESADREVYKILYKKGQKVPGISPSFTIEREPFDPLEGLPRRFQPLPSEQAESDKTTTTSLGPGASQTGQISAADQSTTAQGPPALISLPKALEIAMINSRDYQSRKEDVYLEALSLTYQRYKWRPIFSGLLSGLWKKQSYDETVDGETHLVDDRTESLDTDFGMNLLLADGASIALDLSSSFLRHLTGDPRETAASLFTAKLIQPLLRGAGRRIAQEQLTQAERNVIYEIRSFSRYRKTFAIDIASSYYRVLQQRDVVKNEWNNYRNLTLERERAELMAKAGELPEFQVDQARQNELTAKDRWVRAMEQYEQVLDNFKIDLGLPPDANVELDLTELEKLAARGLIHPQISQDRAVSIALEKRLDLMNAQDRLTDAERKVDVAKNGLLPDVNLVGNYSVDTEPPRSYTHFQYDRETYSAGVDVDLPLDRKSERNTYRETLISFDRTQRSLSLSHDNVILEVRQAWRRLQQAKQSYEIQKLSLALAERRVESTTLLLEAGRAIPRDLLEAREALVESQNAVTGALIDHTIARLQLARDMETLTITQKGIWQEESNVVSQANSQPAGVSAVR
jgi:outer membrane protein TolC